jgi:CIC family chloride channel protein
MNSSQHCFPVVDASGQMTGVVTLGQVRQFLDDHDDDIPAIAHDLASKPRSTLSPADDLDRALQRLTGLDVEELPVVEASNPGLVLGILSRRDIIAVYARRRFESGPGARAAESRT